MPDARFSDLAEPQSRARPALAGESTVIDSSSPWDGPHPGLAADRANGGAIGSRPLRTAPIGIVRLPASLQAPRRRGRRPPRHAGDNVGTSRQPSIGMHRLGIHDVMTHTSGMRSHLTSLLPVRTRHGFDEVQHAHLDLCKPELPAYTAPTLMTI